MPAGLVLLSQTPLLFKHAYWLSAAARWMLAGLSPINQHACWPFVTQYCMSAGFSICYTCWYGVSLSAINSKWVWSGNTTITNRRQPCGIARKSRSTITRHQEDKLSKATSSLFPIKMIAILELTYSNVQQNIEQLQTPTTRVTMNKKSTTTEPPPCLLVWCLTISGAYWCGVSL